LSIKTTKTEAHFEYLAPDTVLTGLETATIGLTAQDLSDRAGIRWTADEDELGNSQLAVFRLAANGPRYALRFYDDAPFPGVILASDASAKAKDIDTVLEVLGVTEGELIDRVPVRDVRVPTAAKRPARGGRGSSRTARTAGPVRARAARKAGLSKAGLVEAVAADSGLGSDASARVIESLLDTVTKSLKNGEEVAITGFGKFSVVKRAARPGVNPRTGERVTIKASKAPKFSAGAGLKRSVKRTDS
jgi:DNA-binding protein HU-beta